MMPGTLLTPAATTAQGIELTDEFVAALKLLEAAEEHAFITGRAGTGKSMLLRHFIATTQRRVAVLAPTGLAAVHIGGQTIHSFFKFPPRILEPRDSRVLPHQRTLFEALDTIVIDEISMVRADVLDAIDRSLRLNRGRHEVPFGGVQIVAFGDLLQLAPVVQGELRDYFADAYETPYFFSANVLNRCEWRLLHLTRNYRQGKDPYFFDLLTRLGHNQLSSDDLQSLNSRVLADGAQQDAAVVTLTSTHAAAAAINASHLNALPGQPVYFHAKIKGDFDAASCPADAALVLKAGAQIMMLRNDPDKRWVNGDVGIVERCSSDEIWVRIRGDTYEVLPVAWERHRYTFSHEENRVVQQVAGLFKQYPLKLAWAITIHKSQGQTLQRAVIDLGRGAFAHGQVYVALSRCTNLEGLWLRRPLRPSDILFDTRVRHFLERRSIT